MKQADTTAICPKCNSTSVNTPALFAGEYTCNACGWKGDDPFLLPFWNPHGNADNTFQAFQDEFMNVFAKHALPFGLVLVKWGFVERDANGKPLTKVLARYLKAMAVAVVKGIFQEAQAIELEKRQAERKNEQLS